MATGAGSSGAGRSPARRSSAARAASVTGDTAGVPSVLLRVAGLRYRQPRRAHQFGDRRRPLPQDRDGMSPALGGPPDGERRRIGIQGGAELHPETREPFSRRGGENEVAPVEQQEETPLRLAGGASQPLGKEGQARGVHPPHPQSRRFGGRLVLLGDRCTRHRTEHGPAPERTGSQRSEPESPVELGGRRRRSRGQPADELRAETAHRSGTRALGEAGVGGAVRQRNHRVPEAAVRRGKSPQGGLHCPGRLHRRRQVRLGRRRRDELRRQAPPDPAAIARANHQVIPPKGHRHGPVARTEARKG